MCIRDRGVLLAGTSFDVLETYLKDREPSKVKTDQANLAFAVIKELTRRVPGRVGRPLAEPDPDDKGNPPIIDVTQLTHTAMSRGLGQTPPFDEEGELESSEEEDDDAG